MYNISVFGSYTKTPECYATVEGMPKYTTTAGIKI
jgi:hypothetical protein